MHSCEKKTNSVDIELLPTIYNYKWDHTKHGDKNRYHRKVTSPCSPATDRSVVKDSYLWLNLRIIKWTSATHLMGREKGLKHLPSPARRCAIAPVRNSKTSSLWKPAETCGVTYSQHGNSLSFAAGAITRKNAEQGLALCPSRRCWWNPEWQIGRFYDQNHKSIVAWLGSALSLFRLKLLWYRYRSCESWDWTRKKVIPRGVREWIKKGKIHLNYSFKVISSSPWVDFYAEKVYIKG